MISGERDRYTLDLQPGETLDVQVTALESNAVFTILGPDRAPIPGTQEGQDITQWSAPISVGGVYAILVGPTRGSAMYTLKVQVSGPP